MRILVLGATGLLGNTIFRVLNSVPAWNVYGTVRTEKAKQLFSANLAGQLLSIGDVEDHTTLERLFAETRPEVVINCVALRRDVSAALDPLRAISLYSLLPHRLSRLCEKNHSRLIQISSDGVFSGAKGKYTEEDFPDATDIYGTAKLLGEVRESHAITIRVSIIGHELGRSTGLLEWFLSQESQCRCFTRSIFSGLPTVVLAEIIRDIVVPRSELTGIYHVAAMPISKFDLLSLVAEIYGKKIEIIPETQRVIDRSLTADKFYRQTGYSAPGWRQLVETMHLYR